jgi:hypothetical protein
VVEVLVLVDVDVVLVPVVVAVVVVGSLSLVVHPARYTETSSPPVASDETLMNSRRDRSVT